MAPQFKKLVLASVFFSFSLLHYQATTYDFPMARITIFCKGKNSLNMKERKPLNGSSQVFLGLRRVGRNITAITHLFLWWWAVTIKFIVV
jgi:hypothetical protein